MIPKLTFKVADNPEGMIDIIESFILNLNPGFNWSGIYSKAYPEFGKLIEGKSKKEIKTITREFFEKLHQDKLKDLKSVAKKFQREWDKTGDELLTALSEIVEMKWPRNCKDMTAWVSLNPICPRFLDQKSFDIFWKFENSWMKRISVHEILHFIWFEKWKKVFPRYDKREFESPHLMWKLSEMVPLAILSDERLQKIFRHEPSVYDEWKSVSIGGKPLLGCIQEIYKERKSFEDFMKKSWKFVKKHEKELR